METYAVIKMFKKHLQALRKEKGRYKFIYNTSL